MFLFLFLPPFLLKYNPPPQEKCILEYEFCVLSDLLLVQYGYQSDVRGVLQGVEGYLEV